MWSRGRSAICGLGRPGKGFVGSMPVRRITSHPRLGREWTLFVIGIGAGAVATVGWSYQDSFSRTIQLDSLAVDKGKKQGDKGVRTITLEELEEHRAGDSVWVAVEGTVWDVTHWLPDHPGGAQVLLESAGTDATTAFKALHEPGTIEKHLDEKCNIGRLESPRPQTAANTSASSKQGAKQPDDWVPSETPHESEDDRIKRARAELIGVNSLTCIDDMERLAKDLLPATVWEYYSTGSDSESAMRNNSSAYDRVFLRPRVMRQVADVDTSTTIIGVDSSVPFYISPTARNGAGNPLGEVAVTQGAAAQGAFQILSNVASKSLDEVMNARAKGQQIGWQLYMKADRKKAEEEIKKAHALGAHSIWLTVDTTILGKRIRQTRGAAERNPSKPGSALIRGPPSTLLPSHDAQLQWSDIKWIKSLAPGIPVVVKGVGAWEDVALAKVHGADAVVLSNHGGRQLDFADAPLKTLYDLHRNNPDILKQADFSVFVDGGIRRGTDILKALCLGAKAVGLGRPFIYAGAGWGSDGVEKAILLLKGELEISMRLLGVTKVDQLGPEYLNCEKL